MGFWNKLKDKLKAATKTIFTPFTYLYNRLWRYLYVRPPERTTVQQTATPREETAQRAARAEQDEQGVQQNAARQENAKQSVQEKDRGGTFGKTVFTVATAVATVGAAVCVGAALMPAGAMVAGWLGVSGALAQGAAWGAAILGGAFCGKKVLRISRRTAKEMFTEETREQVEQVTAKTAEKAKEPGEKENEQARSMTREEAPSKDFREIEQVPTPREQPITRDNKQSPVEQTHVEQNPVEQAIIEQAKPDARAALKGMGFNGEYTEADAEKLLRTATELNITAGQEIKISPERQAESMSPGQAERLAKVGIEPVKGLTKKDASKLISGWCVKHSKPAHDKHHENIQYKATRASSKKFEPKSTENDGRE